MSKLAVYDVKGSSVGELEFSDDLLVSDKGAQAVHDAVVAELAARRAGTASTLSKGKVAGSGKKPWRQKGTGRARAGYRQSPVWRGGSVAFGPHPRDYSVKTNKKVSHLAFKRAFSDKVSAGQVKVVEGLTLPEAKTKSFVELMKSLDVSAPAIFLLPEVDRNFALAARNIPNIQVVKAGEVGVYQLLRYSAVVIDKAALEVVKKRFEKKTRSRDASDKKVEA